MQTSGNQHSTVLVERSNNGSHFFIFPHRGFTETDVNWLYLGGLYGGSEIMQGQIDVQYTTKTLCRYVTFPGVSRHSCIHITKITFPMIF